MSKRSRWVSGVAALVALTMAVTHAGQRPASGPEGPPPTPLTTTVAKPDARVAALKETVSADVLSMYDLGQQMVDMVFSFGELGFQEFETQKYLTGILEKNGFTIETGIAGIPTAWVARYGSGRPVIALGSDVDGIPQASQKPGVAYRDQIVEGAPGHGEGHNSGSPLNVLAAIAVKRVMEREKLPGTLMIWPGVAEEQLGTKAYYVRAGLFQGVDAVLYNHVGSNLATAWGDSSGNGLISVEYTFEGETAHSAGAPWRGRSALDAVELMNAGGTSGASTCGCSSARTTSSPTAAISPTWSRATPASGTTSAKRPSRGSRTCGTSATRSPRGRR